MLYHNDALATNVVVDDILKDARKNQEVAGKNSDNTNSAVASGEMLEVQVSELKKAVKEQQHLIDRLVVSNGTANGSGGVGFGGVDGGGGWKYYEDTGSATSGGGLNFSRRDRNESSY